MIKRQIQLGAVKKRRQSMTFRSASPNGPMNFLSKKAVVTGMILIIGCKRNNKF